MLQRKKIIYCLAIIITLLSSNLYVNAKTTTTNSKAPKQSKSKNQIQKPETKIRVLSDVDEIKRELTSGRINFITEEILKTKQLKAKIKTYKNINYLVFQNPLRFKDFVMNTSTYELGTKTLKKHRDILEKEYNAHPAVYSAIVDYGLALIDLNEIDEAEKVFVDSTKHFMVNPGPRIYKAWVDALNGNYVEGKNVWYPVVKDQFEVISKGLDTLWMPVSVKAALGLYLISDKLSENDKNEIKDTADVIPGILGTPEFVALRIYKDFKNKKIDSVPEKIETSLKYDPINALSITLLGITYLSVGENEVALALFDKANKIYDLAPTNHYMRSKALYSLNKKQEAVEAISKAIEIDPKWEEIKLEKENYLKEMKNLATSN